MRFLLFTLYGPMASFGEIAVGERRMSWARPARSAVLGLIGAALGIDRSNEAAHHALETGLFLAVRSDAPGRPFMDYHTTQTPKSKKGQSFATRREELEAEDLHTVLSGREWRTDAYFTTALWLRPESAVDLDEIARALRRPHFTLSAGRKSGPLGLPLNPAIIDADTFREALDLRRPNDVERAVLENVRVDGVPGGELWFDMDAPGAPSDVRVVRRRDAVVSRERWQFADRFEASAAIDREKE